MKLYSLKNFMINFQVIQKKKRELENGENQNKLGMILFFYEKTNYF